MNSSRWPFKKPIAKGVRSPSPASRAACNTRSRKYRGLPYWAILRSKTSSPSPRPGAIASAPRLHLDDIRRRFAADNRLEPARPCVEGVPHLRLILKAVVSRRDPSDDAAAMIEHALDNVWRDPDLGHSGRRRSPEIVQDPRLRRGHAGRGRLGEDHGVNLALRFAEPRRRRPALRTEDEGAAKARQALDDTRGRVTHRNFMRDAIFRSLFRERPYPCRGVDLLPAHAGDLASPRAGQQQ